MKTKIMPCIIIGISIAAAIMYLCSKDYRRAIYWLAAATLNAAVTF